MFNSADTCITNGNYFGKNKHTNALTPLRMTQFLLVQVSGVKLDPVFL